MGIVLISVNVFVIHFVVKHYSHDKLSHQGRTVSEVRTSHRSWISLALLLLSPFILYGLFILYGDLSARYTAYQHVQWLTDFYVKNAPEVS